ncbi:hypothetical protein FAP94_04445 [Morganella morganii]|nr:hypothetical protein [Morganella morganii]
MKRTILLLASLISASLYGEEVIIEEQYLELLKIERPIGSLDYNTPFCASLLNGIKDKNISPRSPEVILEDISNHDSACDIQQISQFTQIDHRHWSDKMLSMGAEELKAYGSTFTPFTKATLYKGKIEEKEYTFLVNSCFINTQIFTIKQNYEPIECRDMGMTYLTVIDEGKCENHGSLQTTSYHNYNNGYVGVFDYQGNDYVFSRGGDDRKRTLSVYISQSSKRAGSYSFQPLCRYTATPNKAKQAGTH